MATVLITGGTGMIGTAITKELLKRNYDVIILSRSPEKYSGSSRLRYAAWDPANQKIDKNAVMEADHIIHLAGAGIADKRWTRKRKNEIVESRTKGTELITRVLSTNKNKVKTVVAASAIGWYGPNMPDQSKGFAETDPASTDFLGITCKEWETSIDPVLQLGKRLVKFRMGIVLSNEGGVFKEFEKPLSLGIATIMGKGRQVISWIHIDDLVRLYIYAVENEKLNGIYNAVAPFPVTNRSFILELARKKRGKFFIPVFVPSFVLRLMFGELSIEVLKSATVNDDKIKNTGFTFLYPSIAAAIQNLIAS
jgi:hypothetical protein